MKHKWVKKPFIYFMLHKKFKLYLRSCRVCGAEQRMKPILDAHKRRISHRWLPLVGRCPSVAQKPVLFRRWDFSLTW